MKLKAVLFDMDGVLCDSEALLARAACRLFLERYGARVAPEEFLPHVGTGEKKYLGSVAGDHGVTLQLPGDKDLLYRMYLEMVPGQLMPVRGVPRFVADCRTKGLKTAVATSADRVKLDGALAAIDLPPAGFDAIVTGSDITHTKPDPEIFLTAAARLGVEPAAALVVEDSQHGIAAARAAGCPCLALSTTFDVERLMQCGPDWISRDLTEAALREAGFPWLFSPPPAAAGR